MRKIIVAVFLFMVFIFPALTWADCESDTKTCEDWKAGANRCAQTYGFRAEVACADWNKTVAQKCGQAQKSCGQETGSQTSPSRRSQ